MPEVLGVEVVGGVDLVESAPGELLDADAQIHEGRVQVHIGLVDIDVRVLVLIDLVEFIEQQTVLGVDDCPVVHRLEKNLERGHGRKVRLELEAKLGGGILVRRLVVQYVDGAGLEIAAQGDVQVLAVVLISVERGKEGRDERCSQQHQQLSGMPGNGAPTLSRYEALLGAMGARPFPLEQRRDRVSGVEIEDQAPSPLSMHPGQSAAPRQYWKKPRCS